MTPIAAPRTRKSRRSLRSSSGCSVPPGSAGTIRQLGRGLYDYPKLHQALGPLAPTPEALAKAMAGRDRVRLQPSGAYAANLLGLSEQVPAKVLFSFKSPLSRGVLLADEVGLGKTSRCSSR